MSSNKLNPSWRLNLMDTILSVYLILIICNSLKVKIWTYSLLSEFL
jgi:hypothetical protein